MRLHFVFSQQRRQLRKELSFSLERACDQRLELVFHGQRQRRRFGSAEVVIPQPEQKAICERILPSPLVPLRQLLGIDREALRLSRSMRPQQERHMMARHAAVIFHPGHSLLFQEGKAA